MSGNILATNNFNKFIAENRIPIQTVQGLIDSCVSSPNKFAQVEFEFVGKKRFIRAYIDVNQRGEILLSADKDYN